MATQDTCCTIVPYFKANSGKLESFNSLCERFVAKTANEPKCLYYGWSFDGERRRCVLPYTEWLHQLHLYGQPRAVNGASASVISDTCDNPALASSAAIGSRNRLRASRRTADVLPLTRTQASTNAPISHGQTVPW